MLPTLDWAAEVAKREGQRNEYIASVSDELVFSSVTAESSHWPLTLMDKQVIVL